MRASAQAMATRKKASSRRVAGSFGEGCMAGLSAFGGAGAFRVALEEDTAGEFAGVAAAVLIEGLRRMAFSGFTRAGT